MGMEPSDEVLVQRCLDGESAAFDVLVQRYQTRVYHLAYRLTHHAEDANDLAQEVFVRVYERLHTFRPDAPFWPWLRRVAMNWGLNWLKRQRLPQISLETGASTDEEEAGIDLPDWESDPARRAETRAMQAEVQRAIASLPLKYRAAVVLRYAEGLSYEEIAQTLQLPLGTVKTHLFRAKAMLQERLATVYRDYFEA
jgi:RNA polymerase sigma-70 factor (ECF subfamily)